MSSYLPLDLIHHQPSIISKLFTSIISKVFVDLLNRDIHLKDKQYEFLLTLSTADIVNVITHKTSESLLNRYVSRATPFDISKDFDKV